MPFLDWCAGDMESLIVRCRSTSDVTPGFQHCSLQHFTLSPIQCAMSSWYHSTRWIEMWANSSRTGSCIPTPPPLHPHPPLQGNHSCVAICSQNAHCLICLTPRLGLRGFLPSSAQNFVQTWATLSFYDNSSFQIGDVNDWRSFFSLYRVSSPWDAVVGWSRGGKVTPRRYRDKS